MLSSTSRSFPSSRFRANAGADPFGGALFAGEDRLVGWHGPCVFAKRLEQDRFHWPKLVTGMVPLSAPRLMALVEGMDWTRVRAAPQTRRTSVG
ncbi:IS66 family insertion sequence element accessory protein TnpB [Methylocystis heyeri]